MEMVLGVLEVGVHVEVVALGVLEVVDQGVLGVVCFHLRFDIEFGFVLVHPDPDSEFGIGFQIQPALGSDVGLAQILRLVRLLELAFGFVTGNLSLLLQPDSVADAGAGRSLR